MPTMRRAAPRSKVIQSLDEFRASLAGQPDEWIDQAVAQEARERADLERWSQDAYERAPGRDYNRIED